LLVADSFGREFACCQPLGLRLWRTYLVLTKYLQRIKNPKGKLTYELRINFSQVNQMNTVKSFLLIALIAIVAVGCGKVEKILPKKDGVWKVVKQEQRIYENNVLVETLTDISVTSFTFKDDDSGTYVDDGTTYPFTWSVNDDNDEISLCETDSGVSICLAYTILESDNKTQEWFLTIADDSIRTEFNINLERE
jgi:hypothetical protein